MKTYTHAQFLEKLKQKVPNYEQLYEIVSEYTGQDNYLLVKGKYGICSIVSKRLLQNVKLDLSNAIDKNEYFLNLLLDKNNSYKNKEFKILEPFKSLISHILVETKYGTCRIIPRSLLNGINPSIVSAIDKTSFFKKVLIDNNEQYRNGTFKIVSEYKTSSSYIILKDKYGYCKMLIGDLLKGHSPSFRSAVFKHQYFSNRLLFSNKHYYKRKFVILSNIESSISKVIVKNKYGLCEMTANQLLKGANATIQSAINSKEYFINRMTEIHGNKYDFTDTDYINTNEKVSVMCYEHGVFTTTPSSLLQGVNCRACADEGRIKYTFNNWNDMCPGNAGMFYVIKCYNETESFIKIGITCNSVEQRYYGTRNMPYQYKILFSKSDFNRKYIWDIEKELKRNLKSFKYVPELYFGGASTECFDSGVLSLIKDYVRLLDASKEMD